MALKHKYELTKDESKLLGEWINVTFTDLVYNYYTFFPNKFFLLTFNIEKMFNNYIEKNIVLTY